MRLYDLINILKDVEKRPHSAQGKHNKLLDELNISDCKILCIHGYMEISTINIPSSSTINIPSFAKHTYMYSFKNLDGAHLTKPVTFINHLVEWMI